MLIFEAALPLHIGNGRLGVRNLCGLLLGLGVDGGFFGFVVFEVGAEGALVVCGG